MFQRRKVLGDNWRRQQLELSCTVESLVALQGCAVDQRFVAESFDEPGGTGLGERAR